VSDFISIGAATSPVLGRDPAGEAAAARRTVPPVTTVKGTGLPIGGFGTSGVAVVLMGADQVQGATTARIQAVADPGISPRRGPVRC
jgi:hypothetical protein